MAENETGRTRSGAYIPKAPGETYHVGPDGKEISAAEAKRLQREAEKKSEKAEKAGG